MMEFDSKETIEQRKNMVERQLILRGIKNQRVIEAFLRVPRHLFVPSSHKDLSYQDTPLPIGYGQTISQPYIVALMVELLNPQEDDRVLEVGTGSGYEAAILAELVKMVYSVERLPELVKRANGILSQLGYRNVVVVEGDGSKGLPEFSPYDKTIVSACSKQIYPAWVEELKEGGMIVLPLEEDMGQNLIRGIKKRGKLVLENHGGCVFVPLVEDEL
ncbi:MAG TPA: protein-L-isoaspartate(D-aspartate) O-methyltransferase [Candidatus Atribacteria bacterium]|nr:protein-L-isoaspartate(D-aspartate) O-methyltransferase [Candidatus Atribacteria bacterium]